MKREEIHSLGIHLGTGEILEHFYETVRKRKLVSRIPANIHLLPAKLTLHRAAGMLEDYMEKMLKRYDRGWADAAHVRLEDEWRRIDGYYLELLNGIDPDREAEIRQQYDVRRQEAEWQYRPKIQVSPINCGLFHLGSSFGRTDGS
jgi:hypothetical protein